MWAGRALEMGEVDGAHADAALALRRTDDGRRQVALPLLPRVEVEEPRGSRAGCRLS